MIENQDTATAHASSITFVSRSAPYGNNKSKLCLDMALASAVFEQNVCYVFLDDGVYQLLKGQDGGTLEQKTLGNALETLALYGIENVYVDRLSLQQRNIDAADLIPSMQLIDAKGIAEIIDDSDTVFTL